MHFEVFQSIDNFFPDFPSRNISVKTKINGNLNMKYLVIMVSESKLLSQAETIFAWSAKKYAIYHYPDEINIDITVCPTKKKTKKPH